METQALRVAQAFSRMRRVTHDYLGPGEHQRYRVVEGEVSELGLGGHMARGGHGSPSLLLSFQSTKCFWSAYQAGH